MSDVGARYAFVVMGVSGCGKSTLGRALAVRLGIPFIEGDELHPPANVAKMAAGIPLHDRDRMPFLDAVARSIALSDPGGVVVSCSALKRAYRTRITERARRAVCFIMPDAPKEQIEARLRERSGHFMPTSLLDSQFATLERPQPDENCLTVVSSGSAAQQVDQLLAALARRTAERADRN